MALFVVLMIKAKNLHADILSSKDLIVTTMQSGSLAVSIGLSILGLRL